MADMAALWGYEESPDVEQLGQKLLLTTLELEKLKSEAMEEISKNKEHINQLLHLLKHALHERDQAKSQLHNLLLLNNKIINSFPAKANSSITESNSLSDHDSLFDGGVAVSSSNDFSTPNAAAGLSYDKVAVDQGSLAIDELARGRALPHKGKLLQAVVRAGPLLQTLLVAGPLPRWRNPPRFEPFQMPTPPLSIRGCDQPDHMGHFGPRAAFGQPSAAAPVMDFASAGLRASGPTIGSYAPMAKRHRFC